LPPLPKQDDDPDGSLRKRQRVALLEHLEELNLQLKALKK